MAVATRKKKTTKPRTTKPKVVKPEPKKKAPEETPEVTEPDPVGTLKLRQDALDQVRKIYEEHLTDEMGKLHNQFVAFVSESRLPLPQVLIVLEMLKAETIEIARQKYMGG